MEQEKKVSTRTLHGAGDKFHGIMALYVILCAAINWGVIGDLTIPFLEANFARGIGLALLVVGAVFLKLSMGQIKSAFKKKVLITDGLFALTRNPAEGTWIFFIVPGLALLSYRLIMLTAIPFQAWLFIYLIPEEEAVLEKEFGQAYVEYKKSVPRLIPKAPSY